MDLNLATSTMALVDDELFFNTSMNIHNSKLFELDDSYCLGLNKTALCYMEF